MQTTKIRERALNASAYKQERLIAKGYSLTVQDVQWVKGLALCFGVSESQILRAILARARELEIEFADKREGMNCSQLPPVDRRRLNHDG